MLLLPMFFFAEYASFLSGRLLILSDLLIYCLHWTLLRTKRFIGLVGFARFIRMKRLIRIAVERFD